jgi:NTE family protein
MKPRLATLALGGGGARGVAHLGAIKEVLAAGISVERIVGVSSGSLVGAMFAFDPDIERVTKRALGFLQSCDFARQQERLLRVHPVPATVPVKGVMSGYQRLADLVRANRLFYRAVRQSSLVPGRLLQEVVNHLLPDADIEDAKVPLSIVAVDLDAGRPVVFEHGPVRIAAQASAAVPGVFPPVSCDGRLLCDIGGLCALPLWVARSYDPHLLIAVDVGATLKPLAPQPTALDVMMRMNDIGSAMFRAQLRSEADLTIVPDVDNVQWFDFTTAPAVVEAGAVAARSALASLPPPQNWLKRMIGDGLPRLGRLGDQIIHQLPRNAAGL